MGRARRLMSSSARSPASTHDDGYEQCHRDRVRADLVGEFRRRVRDDVTERQHRSRQSVL